MEKRKTISHILILKGVSVFTFFRCICGLLKKKPRILVTHQLQYLKAAHEIVVLKEVCVYMFVFIRFCLQINDSNAQHMHVGKSYF